MSDFNQTYYNILIKYEGGYRPAPYETYRGIDRTQDPGKKWAGWALVDAYKKSHTLKRYDTIVDNAVEESVKQFYLNVYLPTLIKPSPSALEKQGLADLVIDFIIHKPYDAVRVINNILAATDGGFYKNKYRLTAEAVALLNSNPVKFYSLIRTARIGYYMDPAKYGSLSYTKFSPADTANFVARAKSFPSNIT